MKIREKTLTDLVNDILSTALGIVAEQTYLVLPALREDYFLLLANEEGEIVGELYVPSQQSHVSAATTSRSAEARKQDKDNYITALDSIDSILKGQMPDSLLPSGQSVTGYALAAPPFGRTFADQLPFLVHLTELVSGPMKTLFIDEVWPTILDASFAVSQQPLYELPPAELEELGKDDSFKGAFQLLKEAGFLEPPWRLNSAIIDLFARDYVAKAKSDPNRFLSAYTDKGERELVKLIAK